MNMIYNILLGLALFLNLVNMFLLLRKRSSAIERFEKANPVLRKPYAKQSGKIMPKAHDDLAAYLKEIEK